MTSKSLTYALRHRCREVGALTQCATSQHRAFSSSPRSLKHGAVPVLSESTSSPELTALLQTIRRTIFLPALITKQHQMLIYSLKGARTLEEEPVKVELAGEEFRLQHIDRTKDQPNGWKSLLRAIGLFETKADWDNLPRLLEGFKEAKRKILKDDIRFEKLVRISAQKGRMDVIVECLRRSAVTGFKLQSPREVAFVMFWILYEAGEKGFDSEATNKALRMAEEVVRALEGDLKLRREIGHDVEANSAVVGTLLGLSAKKAQMEGKDIGGKAQIYAERLLDITATSINSTAEEDEDIFKGFRDSALFGLKTAAEVLPLKDQLNARAAKISKDIPSGSPSESHKWEISLNEWCGRHLAGGSQ